MTDKFSSVGMGVDEEVIKGTLSSGISKKSAIESHQKEIENLLSLEDTSLFFSALEENGVLQIAKKKLFQALASNNLSDAEKKAYFTVATRQEIKVLRHFFEVAKKKKNREQILFFVRSIFEYIKRQVNNNLLAADDKELQDFASSLKTEAQIISHTNKVYQQTRNLLEKYTLYIENPDQKSDFLTYFQQVEKTIKPILPVIQGTPERKEYEKTIEDIRNALSNQSLSKQLPILVDQSTSRALQVTKGIAATLHNDIKERGFFTPIRVATLSAVILAGIGGILEFRNTPDYPPAPWGSGLFSSFDTPVTFLKNWWNDNEGYDRIQSITDPEILQKHGDCSITPASHCAIQPYNQLHISVFFQDVLRLAQNFQGSNLDLILNVLKYRPAGETALIEDTPNYTPSVVDIVKWSKTYFTPERNIDWANDNVFPKGALLVEGPASADNPNMMDYTQSRVYVIVAYDRDRQVVTVINLEKSQHAQEALITGFTNALKEVVGGDKKAENPNEFGITDYIMPGLSDKFMEIPIQIVRPIDPSKKGEFSSIGDIGASYVQLRTSPKDGGKAFSLLDVRTFDPTYLGKSYTPALDWYTGQSFPKEQPRLERSEGTSDDALVSRADDDINAIPDISQNTQLAVSPSGDLYIPWAPQTIDQMSNKVPKTGTLLARGPNGEMLPDDLSRLAAFGKQISPNGLPGAGPIRDYSEQYEKMFDAFESFTMTPKKQMILDMYKSITKGANLEEEWKNFNPNDYPEYKYYFSQGMYMAIQERNHIKGNANVLTSDQLSTAQWYLSPRTVKWYVLLTSALNRSPQYTKYNVQVNLWDILMYVIIESGGNPEAIRYDSVKDKNGNPLVEKGKIVRNKKALYWTLAQVNKTSTSVIMNMLKLPNNYTDLAFQQDENGKEMFLDPFIGGMFFIYPALALEENSNVSPILETVAVQMKKQNKIIPLWFMYYVHQQGASGAHNKVVGDGGLYDMMLSQGRVQKVSDPIEKYLQVFSYYNGALAPVDIKLSGKNYPIYPALVLMANQDFAWIPRPELSTEQKERIMNAVDPSIREYARQPKEVFALHPMALQVINWQLETFTKNGGLRLTSLYRNIDHNDEAGGEENSLHTKRVAWDIGNTWKDGTPMSNEDVQEIQSKTLQQFPHTLIFYHKMQGGAYHFHNAILIPRLDSISQAIVKQSNANVRNANLGTGIKESLYPYNTRGPYGGHCGFRGADCSVRSGNQSAPAPVAQNPSQSAAQVGFAPKK